MLIAHATDLTGDDAPAFLHAAALAGLGNARLVTVYAGPDREATPPDAAALASRWGRAFEYEFRHAPGNDREEIADTVLASLRAVRPDLIVIGTHARHGLAALVHGSVGEALARNLEAPVLVVPNSVRGFVDPRDGAIDLARIVIPAGNAEDARRGIEGARRLLALAQEPAARLEIVHAGPVDPELARLGAAVTRIDGVLEDAIVDAVRARDACMIAMATRGHDSVGDVLLGSHTERVIREASCPVLSVRI
jgi:nucleotide-binding universal stress UspA family protein